MKQAFPVMDNKNTNALYECTDPGMTLRDYFAAKAMQAMIPNAYVHDNKKTIAEFAYEMADAMMNARGQQ